MFSEQRLFFFAGATDNKARSANTQNSPSFSDFVNLRGSVDMWLSRFPCGMSVNLSGHDVWLLNTRYLR